MAELPTLQPNRPARVLRGRHKDAIVMVAREDEEFVGFWWCVYEDRTGNGLVLREVLVNAAQLEQSEKGAQPC